MATKASCVSTVSGIITAEFRNYSGLSRNVGDQCECVPVILGNTTWSIVLYPGGISAAEGKVPKISCFLKNLSVRSCKANFSLSIVDTAGKEVFIGAGQERIFKSGDSFGYTSFATLPLTACICNNTLTIRASIALQQCQSVAEIVVSDALTFGGERHGLFSTIQALWNENCCMPHDVWLLAISPDEDPQEIGAHKFVLAARSAVFRTMLQGEMKEAQKSEVEITDFSGDAVKAFVRFLYTDSCARDALSHHAVALLAMADKYKVPALYSLCECHLISSLCAANAMALLHLADAHNAVQLRASALQYIVAHARDVAPYAQHLTPELLTEVLSAFAARE